MTPSVAEPGINGYKDDRVKVASVKNNKIDERKRISIPTGLDDMPTTVQRQPYIPKPDDGVVEAGVSRVNIAPSAEKPQGTTENNYAEKHKDQTVLQQHCEYFDRDNDGVIWPSNTYTGCREFGWNPFLASLATFIIHFNLSFPTVPGWLPDPYFRLWIKNMHRNRHGSSSQTYDNEGRYRAQSFEDIFAKFDHGNKGGLSKSDIREFLRGSRMAFDFWGWSATTLEWTAVYLLVWPEDGLVRKEDVRGVYDGSIFYKKAEEHQQKLQKKKKPL